MKNKFLILIFLGLFVSMPSFALLSCDDLDDIADTLDGFAGDFQQLRTRDIDHSVDRALAELVDGLHEVAHAENDSRLTAWTNDLEFAWEDQDREDFEEALDDIIERLDDLYDRDCRRRRY